MILGDPSVHSLGSLWDFFQKSFWSSLHGENGAAYFRPVITLSFALDWRFWNGLPGGFHLTNLLVHLANCLLVYLTARKCGGQFWPSIFAMAALGILPRMAESVAWISGRTDLFAAFFTLLALYLFISQEEITKSNPRFRIFFSCIAIFLCFLATLLSKEVAAAGLAAAAAVQLNLFLRRRTSAHCAAGMALIPLVAALEIRRGFAPKGQASDDSGEFF